MKKIILSLCSCCVALGSYSQVGIGTQNPIGVFHVDTNTDTSGDSNLKDDFIVEKDETGAVSVGIGGKPVPSASLSLNEKNKAFRLNLVELSDSRASVSTNPIKDPVDGMIVFNTTSEGVPPNNVLPGPYVYNSKTDKWLQLTFQRLTREVNAYILATDNFAIPRLSTSYSLDSFLQNGKIIQLSAIDNTERAFETIQLTSSAAYAMALELNGATTTNVAGASSISTFFAVVRMNPDGTKNVLDVVLAMPLVYKSANTDATIRHATYSAILGFNGYMGDNIAIMACQFDDANKTWTLAKDLTVVTLWRL